MWSSGNDVRWQRMTRDDPIPDPSPASHCSQGGWWVLATNNANQQQQQWQGQPHNDQHHGDNNKDSDDRDWHQEWRMMAKTMVTTTQQQWPSTSTAASNCSQDRWVGAYGQWTMWMGDRDGDKGQQAQMTSIIIWALGKFFFSFIFFSSLKL